MTDISRRDFVRAGVLAGVAAGATGERALAQAPAVRSELRKARRHCVGQREPVQERRQSNVCRRGLSTTRQRIRPLDAVIAGVNIVERDPEDTSVGFGGLPNADGIVQLDACCMHGPKKRAGGVAALEGVRTPSLVAKAVMEHTDHHLLVGPGAQAFARNMGFVIEDDLNTPRSRQLWLEWKRRIDPLHYLDPRSAALRVSKLGCRWSRRGSSTETTSTAR